MVYESVRGMQLQNSYTTSGVLQTVSEPLDKNAKEKELKSTQIISGSAEAEGKVLTQSQDKNDNGIEDLKELPGVVKQEEKFIPKCQNEDRASKKDGFEGPVPQCQCEACQRRRYQDGSDDKGVSFQMPTKMDPVTASFKVKAHEMEHVRREQMAAKRENKVVVSQSVRIRRDICEECGTSYVSGGTTVTATRPDLTSFRKLFAVGSDELLEEEKSFDSIA